MMSEAELSKIIKKYLDDTYSQEDIPIIQEILKNAEYNSILNKHLEEHWTELEVSELDLYDEERVRVAKPKRRSLKLKKVLSVAASILLLIGTTVLISKYIPFSGVDNVEIVKIETSFGESRDILLPDGTSVSLNSCSSLSYPSKFSGDQRAVNLEGEAYFNVARDVEKKFVVETQMMKVKVLGTEFNVRSHAEDESETVSVESGKVEVEMTDATIRLVKDEHLNMDKSFNSYNKFTDVSEIAVWRFGRLKFSKTPIQDVANELERIYNCKITFAPKQVFNNKITGEHNNHDVEDVLLSIRLATGIQYKFDKTRNEILFFK